METTAVQAARKPVSIDEFQSMANVLAADAASFISSVEGVIESVNAFPTEFREYLDARFRLQIEQEFNLIHFARKTKKFAGTEYEAIAARIWDESHVRIKVLLELEKKASAVAEVAQ